MSGCVTSNEYIELAMSGTPASLVATPLPSARIGNGFQLLAGDGIFAPGIDDIAGLAFPASGLYDGLLVKTSPGANIAWIFRYNAENNATHQWEFVGGPDYYADIEGQGTINSSQNQGTYGAWQDLNGTRGSRGPDFTAPFNGVYNISWGADINPINSEDAQVGISIASADPVGDDTATATGSVANTTAVGYTAVTRRQQKTLTAGQLVRLNYRGSGGNAPNAAATHKFQRSWLSVTPVRLSGARAAGTYGGT